MKVVSMLKPILSTLAVLTLLAGVPALVAVAPAAAVSPVVAPIPGVQELARVRDQFYKEQEKLRKQHQGVGVLERKYDLPTASVRVNAGEGSFTYEVTLKKPVDRVVSQKLATYLFNAFEQRAVIDFFDAYEADKLHVLYVFLYEATVTQLSAGEEGEGAGCSIEMDLNSKGQVSRVTYVSGS